MSSEPSCSQLPLASVRTDSCLTLAPRLALDDIQLHDAVSTVLARDAVAPAEVVAGVAQALDTAATDSWLLLVDLSGGNTALGGSLLLQALRPDTPDALEPAPAPVDPAVRHALQEVAQELTRAGAVRAARWRGPAGLVGCLLSLAEPGSPDVAINIDPLLIEGYGDGRMDSGEAKNWTIQVSGLRHELTLRVLFTAAPALVLQVGSAQRAEVLDALRAQGLGRNSHYIAHLLAPPAGADAAHARFSVWRDTQSVFSAELATLRGGGGPPRAQQLS